MKLNKQDILKALETISAPGEGQNMVESGAVTNIVTFGDEVVVRVFCERNADFELSNHAKYGRFGGCDSRIVFDFFSENSYASRCE